MNQLGIALVWCALQVSVLGLIAAALYASARRWGPTARSHIALAGIVLVLGLTAFAFSPWPRWQFTLHNDSPSQSALQAAAEPETTVAQPENGPSPNASRPEPSAAAHTDQPSVAAAFWTTFVDELGRPQAAPERADWRWPSIIAALFLAGAAFGSARLLAGWWAVRTLRHTSRPIHDPALLGLLDVAQAELSCRRPIELRESPSLVTAATIGWRKPLILLPAEWTDWTEAERHAVLAHEIAHIARHDFAAWIFAECGLVLHFYHPLVHWLAGRFRLEQELAADAAAAAVTGGQRPYLTTLAAMALRQPDRPLSWPARTFLPTRRTFLRRIEMLRDSTVLNTRASAGLRFAALGVLFLAGLGVAGLRGPDLQAQNDQRGERTTRSAQASEGQLKSSELTFRHIPPNAVGVASVRVAGVYALLKSPRLTELLKEAAFEKQFGVPMGAIEQITVVFLQEDRPAPEPTGFIVRLREPGDAPKMLAALAPEAEQKRFAGKSYFASQAGRPTNYFFPDDTTMIAAANERALLAFINASLGNDARNASWMKALDELKGAHAIAAFDVSWIPQALEQRPPGTPQGELAAMMKMFAPLWLNTRTFALGVSLNGGVGLNGVANATSEEGAQRVEETTQAVLTLARNLIGQGREQIAQAPAEQRELMIQIITLGEDLLKSARVTRNDSTVRLQANAEGDGATALIAAQVFPAVSKAREAAQRQVSMNNLKQIALAMHNYHDTFGGFPPAVLIDQETGVKRSWRVELLPYLGEARLYNQYRKNEPWDSEHNRVILEQMPAVYRNPKMPEDTTTAAYFVLTSPPANDRTGIGSGSLFDSAARAKGPSMRDVTDGTSNTIMTVEAKRDIPWTKPEDIPFDPDKLPRLGDFYEGGFNAAMGDGSVRFFSKNIDTNVLRGVITPAGGELLPNLNSDLERPIKEPVNILGR